MGIVKKDYALDRLTVVKRSGQRVSFNAAKIAVAIKLAFESCLPAYDENDVNAVYEKVLSYIVTEYDNRKTINVEDIQDIIENFLKEEGYDDVYQSFHSYRNRRAASREAFAVKEQHKLVKAIEKVGQEARNAESDRPVDLTTGFGKIISQEFAEAYLIGGKYDRAHQEGRIYIDSVATYALGITSSSQLCLKSLLVPSLDDFTFATLNVIRRFKEEQDGEQTLMNFDYFYERVASWEFKERLANNLREVLSLLGVYSYLAQSELDDLIAKIDDCDITSSYFQSVILNETTERYFQEIIAWTKKQVAESAEKNLRRFFAEIKELSPSVASSKRVSVVLNGAGAKRAAEWRRLYFSVLSETGNIEHLYTLYQTDGEVEDFVLAAVKKGINVTFVIDSRQVCLSDGLFFNRDGEADEGGRNSLLLSRAGVNLARLGLQYAGEPVKRFYAELDEALDLAKNVLLQRYDYQASKEKENYRFIFQDDCLATTQKLDPKQKVRKILRKGTLEIGFFGLSECLAALKKGKKIDLDFGLKILARIGAKTKEFFEETKLEFVCGELENCDGIKEIRGVDKSMFGDKLTGDEYEDLSTLFNTLGINKALSLVGSLQKYCFFNYRLPAKGADVMRLQDALRTAARNGIRVLSFDLNK